METEPTTNQSPAPDSPDVAGCPAPVCSPIRFNVNSSIRARITPHGERCLFKNREDLERQIGRKLPFGFVIPKADPDGWTRFQMWEFMSSFGPHIYNGCKLPFEIEIEIPIPENTKARDRREENSTEGKDS
jgi:hypothetical protein